jgi:hypothetical protein
VSGHWGLITSARGKVVEVGSTVDGGLLHEQFAASDPLALGHGIAADEAKAGELANRPSFGFTLAVGGETDSAPVVRGPLAAVSAAVGVGHDAGECTGGNSAGLVELHGSADFRNGLSTYPTVA